MRDSKDVPRWRWSLIYFIDRLDRRRKRLCWADLVMWAMRDKSDDYPTLGECRVGWMCREGVDRTGPAPAGAARLRKPRVYKTRLPWYSLI